MYRRRFVIISVMIKKHNQLKLQFVHSQLCPSPKDCYYPLFGFILVFLLILFLSFTWNIYYCIKNYEGAQWNGYLAFILLCQHVHLWLRLLSCSIRCLIFFQKPSHPRCHYCICFSFYLLVHTGSLHSCETVDIFLLTFCICTPDV